MEVKRVDCSVSLVAVPEGTVTVVQFNEDMHLKSGDELKLMYDLSSGALIANVQANIHLSTDLIPVEDNDDGC